VNGSVRFLRDSTDPFTIRSLCTPAGGEVVVLD
jgi:hypothetical protein